MTLEGVVFRHSTLGQLVVTFPSTEGIALTAPSSQVSATLSAAAQAQTSLPAAVPEVAAVTQRLRDDEKRLRNDEKQIHGQEREIQQLRKDVSSLVTHSIVPRVMPQRPDGRVCSAYETKVMQEIRNCQEAGMGLCARVVNNPQDQPCQLCKYDLSQVSCTNSCSRTGYYLVDFKRDFGGCTNANEE